MAKVGYIFAAACYDGVDADKEWMCRYGCVQVVLEKSEHEKVRPQWKQLLSNLGRGDELVVSKLSNAVRGSRELAALIELCRIKVVRIISIHDKIDTAGELFPETTPADVMAMVGSLPEEAMALRKASAHIDILKQNIRPPKGLSVKSKEDREKTIVSMYNSGHSIDDIWSVSGFHSRSSVFRILNKYGVTLNRGKFSGPLGKRKKEGEG